MLKNKKLIGRWAAIILGLALPLVLIGHTANASTTKQTTVSEGATINGRLLSFGNSVDINGTVNGDVMCAGQHVKINATINGDILCAAQSITIAGKVNGNIRVTGQDVVIQADVTRAVSAAGQYITLEKDAMVGTDMMSVAANTTVYGQVKRDLDVKGAILQINGSVGRDVEFAGTTLNVASTATVNDSVSYVSINSANIASGADIGGEVSQTKPTETGGMNLKPLGFLGGSFLVVSVLGIIIAALIFALAMGLIFPKQMSEVVSVGGHRFGMSVLVGFVGAIVWGPLMILLALTLIGIPLALFGWALGLACMLFGWAAVAFWLGRKIMTHSVNVAGCTVLGMLILVILCMIPVLGWLFAILVGWFGFGMVLMRLNQTLHKPLVVVEPHAKITTVKA
jgi:cytoskeletal protein CcmA (bactofilin family)